MPACPRVRSQKALHAHYCGKQNEPEDPLPGVTGPKRFLALFLRKFFFFGPLVLLVLKLARRGRAWPDTLSDDEADDLAEKKRAEEAAAEAAREEAEPEAVRIERIEVIVKWAATSNLLAIPPMRWAKPVHAPEEPTEEEVRRAERKAEKEALLRGEKKPEEEVGVVVEAPPKHVEAADADDKEEGTKKGCLATLPCFGKKKDAAMVHPAPSDNTDESAPPPAPPAAVAEPPAEVKSAKEAYLEKRMKQARDAAGSSTAPKRS